jgi:DNA-binding Lrp family transcriptional regulator
MVNSQDELNKKILDTMLEGIGISPRLSDLARELERPRSTIDLRVRLLEDEKIIKGYKPVVNWEKLGYEIEGYVGISCSEESVPAMLRTIRDTDCCSVESVFEVTTGMFDIFAKCRFKNYEEIKELRKLIRATDGVKEIEVFLLGPCYKC